MSKKSEKASPQTRNVFASEFDALVAQAYESAYSEDPAEQARWSRYLGMAADWCGDRGSRDERAVRFLVKWGMRPYRGYVSPPSETKEAKDANARVEEASWFNEATISPGLGDPPSDVPSAVYDRMDEKATGCKVTANHKTFPDARKALDVFVACFHLAVEGGWDPDAYEKPKPVEKPKE